MNTQPHYYSPALIEPDERTLQTDVCIYGGNAAGVIAAVQVARMGKRAVVLQPGGFIGGLTAGGLSCTDSGSKEAIGGLSREFYQRCGTHYGVESEWRFEPHVAVGVLQAMLEETDTPIYFQQFLQSVEMENQRLKSITLQGGLKVLAAAFIDCSYEGDLVAAAGVSYFVGREGNALYGEKLNGVQVHKSHQFDFPTDPYAIEGDPSSGLLPGIDPEPLAPIGSGDKRLQAYNFRLCLSNQKENRIAFEKPRGYDEREYILLARYLRTGWNEAFRKFDKIRGDKVDMNNHGAVSSDFIGRNHAYPEADYETREQIFQQHVTYQKGLMWFLSNDHRVPLEIREPMNEWGLARDEFGSTLGWPHQLYIREARRMVSDYVMTEGDCRVERACDDPIGLASYQMDSHNCRRFVQDGKVFNEGDVQVPVMPYGISLRAILPKRGECENLLVPVCLSSSHIAYGSMRMEPVFMLLAQSAATVACMALESTCSVQNIGYDELRPQLESDGQILRNPMPEEERKTNLQKVQQVMAERFEESAASTAVA
jgi:hypothetical protein